MPYIGSPGNRTSLDDNQTQTDGTAEHRLGRQKSMALFPVLPLLAQGTCLSHRPSAEGLVRRHMQSACWSVPPSQTTSNVI